MRILDVLLPLVLVLLTLPATAAARNLTLPDVLDIVEREEFGGRKCDLLLYGDIQQPVFKDLVLARRSNPMTLLRCGQRITVIGTMSRFVPF